MPPLPAFGRFVPMEGVDNGKIDFAKEPHPWEPLWTFCMKSTDTNNLSQVEIDIN